MYKARIVNLGGAGSYWISKYQIGHVVEFADAKLNYLKKFVKIIEHYRMITVSKEKCPTCGRWIIKRKKIILYKWRK